MLAGSSAALRRRSTANPAAPCSRSTRCASYDGVELGPVPEALFDEHETVALDQGPRGRAHGGQAAERHADVRVVELRPVRRPLARPATTCGGPALGDRVPLIPPTLRLVGAEPFAARRGDELRRASREERRLAAEAVEDEQQLRGPGRVVGGQLEARVPHARPAEAGRDRHARVERRQVPGVDDALLGHGERGERRLRDDAEGALRADQKAREVEARRARGRRARAHDRPVGEHRLERAHLRAEATRAGPQVAEAVGRERAAHGRHADRPGIVPEHETVRRERHVHLGERRAGPRADEARVGVDGHGAEPPRVDDDGRHQDRGRPHEAASAPAGDERDARAGGPAHQGRDLRGARGLRHGERARGERGELGAAARRSHGVEAARGQRRTVGVERERRAGVAQPFEHAHRRDATTAVALGRRG